jgi:acyl-CoA synthetase (AMP-forming)/AMP-acid ligase II
MLKVERVRPLSASLLAGYRRAGLVGDESLALTLGRTARRWPTHGAIRDLTGPEVRGLTFAELSLKVDAVTAFLRRSGVSAGDAVLIQAPNATELLVAWWAAWQAGCVCVPVVEIYRRHELARIVAAVRPAAVFTVAEHRGEDLAGLYDELLDGEGIAAPCRVLIEGEAPGWTAFDAAVAAGEAAPDHGRPQATDPDDPALVLFTSGTTSSPKGVVHSSRTLTAEATQIAAGYALDWRDRAYLPVTLAHVTGLIFGVLVPGTTGMGIVLSRMTGLEKAAAEVVAEGATWTVGPVTEIPHIAAAARAAEVERLALRSFATGGALFPMDVLLEGEELGIGPVRSYGMTECPSVTVPSGIDPARHRLRTDGRLAPGVECRVIDPDSGEPLPAGEEGELRVRGPERMVGYLDPEETRAAIDADGWLRSGDLGLLDEEGCVTVTGRIKDIINRGGEKFSARDIEEVLLAHEAITEIAVVACADDRYGEVPAAFGIAAAGTQPPSPEELASWLSTRGVTKQKLPVHWRWQESLPMTPSGKVRKVELRRRLEDENEREVERR